jgi:hypothetical protein
MDKSNGLSRRDAVKFAGAAGLAVAAVPLGAPAILRASGDRVRFGLIGAGSRGDYLLSHLRNIDNGHCVALCDIERQHLDRFAQTIGTNPAKFKDYRELLSRNDIDAVLVATPLFMHFPVTRDADSSTVMMTNMALDEDRKVLHSEIAELAAKAKKV